MFEQTLELIIRLFDFSYQSPLAKPDLRNLVLIFGERWKVIVTNVLKSEQFSYDFECIPIFEQIDPNETNGRGTWGVDREIALLIELIYYYPHEVRPTMHLLSGGDRTTDFPVI